MDEKLRARYKEILEAYLQHNDEEELYKTSLLSKELINNRVDPDEIIAMHFEILNQAIKNLPLEKMYRIYNNASTVLLELMMSYAVAYREYIEMHERLYLKERELNDFLELFISILSHDLKTPLFNIMGYNELIGDICPDAREYQENIRLSVEKIQELIEDARTYSKVRAVEQEFKVVDLAELLAEVVQELEHKAKEKEITVKRNYNPELKYEVNGSQFLKHAFLNVLDNAIKYSPTGSSVEISLMNQPGEWKVCIKDHGEGVPDEFKCRIFERFVRGAEGGIKGSGIGLAIAKTVVMQNKGRIWVEDNPEGGAIFCITLPKWK